jgi:hypothetical protein
MATLKISKFSVGDWVGVRCGTKINAFKVEEIRFNNVIHKYVAILNNKAYELPAAELQPIPITSEILEKNGLFRHERDADNPELIVLSNHFIMARTYTDVDWWRVLIYDDELPSKELFNGIIYSVRPLQHALRLAEVDKEINL